jgi:hypothetical protein
MKIYVVSSSELEQGDWISYTISFNKAFNKSLSTDYFKQKYLKTIDQGAYHSIIKDNNDIVGSCTVIPVNYLFQSLKVKFGLLVDVFILPFYRNDPFLLYDMYSFMKPKLIEEQIELVIAVPNESVYTYWINVVKWKDIGTIKYYFFPVQLANVFGSNLILINIISFYFFQMNYFFNKVIALLYSKNQNQSLIEIDRSETIVEEQRYNDDHIVNKGELFSYAYRIVIENHIKTAYLIDYYRSQSKKKDIKSLLFSINQIIVNNDIDLIVFIGQINFIQTMLVKVPFKKEPRHLTMIGDLINSNKISLANHVFNICNWDFGLFNLDVR